MSTVVKDLGAVSAYAYAVEKGYTGTEEEFAELMADYADVGQRAEDAANNALESKTAAQTAATTATNKASEATTAAQTATTKAGEASQSASDANTAKEEAVTAKIASETAQGKAEDAKAAAESVAESIPSDYSQLSEDVSDLKEDLNIIDGATALKFESGGLYQDTGVEYAMATRSRTKFIPVTPNSIIRFLFNIPSVTIITVFEFASNQTTTSIVNTRIATRALGNAYDFQLGSSTNYIRVQINVSTTSITTPVLLLDGGYLDDIKSKSMQYIRADLMPSSLYDMPTNKYAVLSGETLRTKDSYFNDKLNNSESYFVYSWNFGSGTRKYFEVFDPNKGRYFAGITNNTTPVTITWYNIGCAINRNAKMISFGNSIMTGSVWQNGSGVGLVDYDDAPYGQIATALGLTRSNVNHTLISSTGLVYDAGLGSFLDNIKDADLTGYDYLLTQMFGKDLEAPGYALGTVNDTVEDSTLAGAVVDLVTYMRTSNGMCQLILVGPPPVSYTYYGETVFTAPYVHGFSIHDVDILMRQMAKKYRFIYIDWEDMALSYYYQNYTDGDNVHANNANTYRVMGEYLASCIRYSNESDELEVAINNIEKYNCYDLLPRFATFLSVTSYTVRFEWNADHTKLDIDGTNSSDSLPATCILYNNNSSLPDGVLPGNKYYVKYNTSNQRVAFRIIQKLNEGPDISNNYVTDGVLNVSPNCIGMIIYVYINRSATVSHAKVSVRLLSTRSNKELAAQASNTEKLAFNCNDLLSVFGTYEDKTSNNVTFAWDGRQCHVYTNGSAASARTECVLYNGILPSVLNIGDKILIRYKSSSGRIGVRCIFYSQDYTELSNKALDGVDLSVEIPSGAWGWKFLIYVNSGIELDGYLTILEVIKIKPKKMDVPFIVSIVDDDTTTDNFVTRFHDSCCHNGVKGNYAVITYNMEDHGSGTPTSPAKLLNYQDEGFGMCIHCYKQAGAPEWNSTPRNDAATSACRANLIKGMQQMQQLGFINYNFWITPGGHKEADLIEMSKQVGNRCLISTNNATHNTMRDYDKYFIKRISLRHNDSGTVVTTPSDFEAVMTAFGDLPADYDPSTYQFRPNSMDGVKYYANKCILDGGGWLIITTHYNDGWGNDPTDESITWDSTLDANGYPIGYPRFNAMVQMVIGKSFVPMSIPQAWQYYEPVLDANRNECNTANTQ